MPDCAVPKQSKVCYGNWRVVTETAPLKTTRKLRKGVTETGFGALQKRRRGVTETTCLSEKLQPQEGLGCHGLALGPRYSNLSVELMHPSDLDQQHLQLLRRLSSSRTSAGAHTIPRHAATLLL